MREKATNVPVAPEARHFLESWTQNAKFLSDRSLCARGSLCCNAKLPCFDSRLRGLIYYYNIKHCHNYGRCRSAEVHTSANYMTVLVTMQLGNDVSLSRWQLEVVIHRDLMRISKILLQRRWSDGEQSVILVA